MAQNVQHTPSKEMANEGSTEIAQASTEIAQESIEMVYSDHGNPELVEVAAASNHSEQAGTEMVHSNQADTEMVQSDQGNTEPTETLAEETIEHEVAPAEEMTSEAAYPNTEIEEVIASSSGSTSVENADADVNSGSERVVEISGNLVNRRQLGGIKTMPYIFANEICDIFAGVGVYANMFTYLTKQLNLPMIKASSVLATFSGISSFLPLLGALIADSFVGRFWTIIMGSIVYILGLIVLLISVVLPSLQPPSCPSHENCQQPSKLQLWVLYISLLLTSIGASGLRPCLSTFAADQLDMSKTSGDAKKWNFFNWYNIGTSLASLTAVTVLAYIQEKCGWAWAFGIPTVAFVISIIAFVGGSHLYVKHKPERSPWVRLIQVTVAAFKKRNLVVSHDSSILYQNRELDASISTNGCLSHSSQFKWLDKAAIITEEEQSNLRNPNLWRLNTVHRVEELKCILRLLPILASGILPAMATSQIGIFANMASQSMNRHLTHSFEIPPIGINVLGILTMIVGLMVYERAFVPMARRFTGRPAGITPLQRIGIGSFIHIIAAIVSAVVESKRKRVAADLHLLDSVNATIPISFLWLSAQSIIYGIAEVFASAGRMEFVYGQSPETMRTTVSGLYGCMGAVGTFLGVALIHLVHQITAPRNEWLPKWNINRGKLDSFYYLAIVIQAINLVYYLIVAWVYVPKPLEEIEPNDVDEQEVDSYLVDQDAAEPDAQTIVEVN